LNQDSNSAKMWSSLQGVPQSNTTITSPFKSGVNFNPVPSMQRQFSPYSL
jgi:hypothetical protein